MQFRKASWTIPVGLLFLSVLPVVGGMTRLMDISGGEVTEQNERFLSSPLPIVFHVLSGAPYLLLGAFQFSAMFRARRPGWHRAAGRFLIPAGLISALSAMWMALFYEPIVGEGVWMTALRLIVGTCVVAFLLVGFISIRNRDIPSHRAWMIRAYALAIGAGTQALTLAPIIIVPQWYGELGFTVGLAAGWIINALVAEWIIRRRGSAERAGQPSIAREPTDSAHPSRAGKSPLALSGRE